MPPHSLGVINAVIEKEFEMVDCFALRKTGLSFVLFWWCVGGFCVCVCVWFFLHHSTVC